MTDNGLVITTEEDFAEVEVDCLKECHDCTARNLCIGNKQNTGRLSVKNPLHAMPGDEVKIQIPDENYSQALILLFGGLLVAILLGTGGGYLLAVVFSLRSSLASFIGLSTGLAIGGYVLSRIFRRKNKKQLYPVIIDIIKKGDCHGSA
ncbi:MAG: SoxR reducing system RseC family protein [Candidatus Aminicenantes bacterium]|nr:MAG: SoxR reducing system RseC family protein [Candidatus Aminicenantes bacterium]